MSGRKRRLMTLVAVAGLSLALGIGTASAQVIKVPPVGEGGQTWEGQWTSFIRNAAVSFKSRTWEKRTPISNKTEIRFQGCSESNGANLSSGEIQLTRETSWFRPDLNKGRKTFNKCQTGAQAHNWNVAVDDFGPYHFAITKINGCVGCFYRLDVSSVRVLY